jgi:hypothetical protein
VRQSSHTLRPTIARARDKAFSDRFAEQFAQNDVYQSLNDLNLASRTAL